MDDVDDPGADDQLAEIQDAARERDMRKRFGMSRPQGAVRHGVDATLLIDGVERDFELKSTSTGSVTTARDASIRHLRKWAGKHWLIGRYIPVRGGHELDYCWYATPTQMAPWIAALEEKILLDHAVAEAAIVSLNLKQMHSVVGRKSKYTRSDVLRLMQRQQPANGKPRFVDRADLKDDFSPAVMLELVRARAEYLLMRGSTRNNPQIRSTTLDTFDRIEKNDVETLRKKVSAWIAAQPNEASS